VETEAWEQRNGVANDVLMSIGGKDAMLTIWNQYLDNIGKAATIGGGTFDRIKATVFARPSSSPNPFAPGIPGSRVSGPALPPGYHRDFVE
jgi:hypothetical protein